MKEDVGGNRKLFWKKASKMNRGKAGEFKLNKKWKWVGGGGRG